MRHREDNWTLVLLYKSGDLFRKFWINPNADNVGSGCHLRHGDVEMRVFGKDFERFITIHRTPQGRKRTMLFAGGLKDESVLIDNKWWQLKSSGIAYDYLANLEATWDGSEWLQKEIGY